MMMVMSGMEYCLTHNTMSSNIDRVSSSFHFSTTNGKLNHASLFFNTSTFNILNYCNCSRRPYISTLAKASSSSNSNSIFKNTLQNSLLKKSLNHSLFSSKSKNQRKKILGPIYSGILIYAFSK